MPMVVVVPMPLVAMCIAVAFPVEVLRRKSTVAVGMFATLRKVAMVAMARVKMIVDMSMEVSRSMKPRPRANKDTAAEPLRAIVAIGRTVVRRV